VVPITIFILLLRAHIVRLLLGYGRCDWNCTIVTFDTLGILALGLVSQSLIPLFARAFYARQNTKTPVVISLIGMAINVILSYFLAHGLGVVGIALGFVIASTIQSILLFVYLHRAFTQIDHVNTQSLQVFDRTIVKQSSKILAASVFLGIACYLTLYLINPFLNTHTVVGIFAQAAIASIVGSIVYVVTTQYLGVKESQAIWRSIGKVYRFVLGKA
jgi:putative peptidoglycan lipid II flippase